VLLIQGVLASGFGSLLFGQTVAGIVLGGIFALSALGLVLVYRVTGVLNFAQGAMGMFSTFVAWKILFDLHPFVNAESKAFTNPPSIVVGVAGALVFSLLLGLVLELGIFRWIRGRPPVVKAVITVGILLTLQAVAALIFGATQYHENIKFFNVANCPLTHPACTSWVIGGFAIGYDQILVVAAALLLAAGLAVFLRVARVGIAMRAVSDDAASASLWGVPVDRIGAVSWMLGSLVATIAAILMISEGVPFDTVSLTLVVVDALAAAMIGGLVSLPLTVAGGFILGLLEAYPKIWISSSGMPKFVALIVILVALLARSQRGLLRKAA
jgi:branched-subunit amino acid ABC-type transport system permease component